MYFTGKSLLRQVYGRPRRLKIKIGKLEKNCGGDLMRKFYLDNYIYVCYGKPIGKKLPAVMHIHGGGQTASEEWVEYFTKLGFACISFDWCGHWENRKDYTKYPEYLEFCNQANMHTQSPDLFKSSWYHWKHIALRVLEYLKQDPDIDENHIGVFGISMGGSLTWNVAAAAELKACAPIYGIGYNDGVHPLMEPSRDALTIKCPTMILNATNDQHGRGDNNIKIYNRMCCPKWISLSKNTCHHIDFHSRNNLKIFFEYFLMGKGEMPVSPILLFENKNGNIYISSNTSDFKVYSATGECDIYRFYREESRGYLTVVNPDETHYVYVTKEYFNGFSLSSPIIPIIPSSIGGIKNSDKTDILFDSSQGVDSLGGFLWPTDPTPAAWEAGFVIERAECGAVIKPNKYYILNSMADNRTIRANKLYFEFYANEYTELEIALGAHCLAPKPFREFHKIHMQLLLNGNNNFAIKDDFTNTPIIRFKSDKEIFLKKCLSMG